MPDNPQNTFDLSQLGLDPSQPFYHLNLAGEHGWPPDPSALAQATPLMTPAIEPGYTAPNMSTPSLRPYDLQMPAITHYPEFTPDPDIPDLTTYNKPYRVDWPTGDMAPREIAQDIASDAEVAASLYPGLGFPMLAISHDVRDLDPPLPDLQHPQLIPDTMMQPEDRPGELDSDALDVMKSSAAYQQTSDEADPYPLSQMNAQGNNSRRARHMGLLTDGIDGDR